MKYNHDAEDVVAVGNFIYDELKRQEVRFSSDSAQFHGHLMARKIIQLLGERGWENPPRNDG